MIPRRNLSLLSNRLAAGGRRRIPEGVLERHYCLAWFLVGLSRAPLRESFAFKGGTALKQCYFADYRFSEDLDFTLTTDRDLPFEAIREALDAVFAEIQRTSGIVFHFVRHDREAHANSHTFYLAYEGPLPAPAAGREVKVDITIRERLVFPIEHRPVLRGYEEYTDLPNDAVIPAYSLGEIAAEKVVALMDRARTEPRDLYDAWFLLNGTYVDLATLVAAIEQKWAFRGKTLGEVRAAFRAKEARYRSLWAVRLGAQMVELPEFEGVYRSVSRSLRQAEIIG